MLIIINSVFIAIHSSQIPKIELHVSMYIAWSSVMAFVSLHVLLESCTCQILHTLIASAIDFCIIYLKQKHLRCKKVQGQSEAAVISQKV